MKYRLYIDEVGNPDLLSSADPNHRYLSLTGVVFELGYVQNPVFPSIESLKARYFQSHPDDPVILHRKQLRQRNRPFQSLRDPAIAQSFDAELLAMFHDLEYVVITAVLDKLEHGHRFRAWRHDPYHYCLEALVERYVSWLQDRGAIGDVLAESRGGAEDRRLKAAFEGVYATGSDFVEPEVFAAHLTSRQLKLKAKSNNIAGLQIADLIAHPSFRATLAHREGQPLPQNFGGRIAAILEATKYDRSPEGRIDGWGRIWLP